MQFQVILTTFSVSRLRVVPVLHVWRTDVFFHSVLWHCWGTGIRGLMRGVAALPKVTRSY